MYVEQIINLEILNIYIIYMNCSVRIDPNYNDNVDFVKLF